MLLILIASLVLAAILFAVNSAFMRKLRQDEIAPPSDAELPQALRDGDERRSQADAQRRRPQ